MIEFFRLLQIVLPVFLVIGVGYVLRRTRVLSAEADQSLLGVLIKVFVPCLALDVIVGNEALTRPANLVFPPLLGFVAVVAGLGVSFLAGRLFIGDKTTRRTFAFTTAIQNYGYIPLPLCQALFDRDVVGVLFAFNLGVEVALWSVAVTTLSGHLAARRWWAPLWNPPILSVLAGILLNFLGAGRWIPPTVDTAWHMLGLCAVPLGLLLTGALLADHAAPRVLRGGWPVTLLGLFIRLGIFPVFLLFAAWFLPLDPALRAVLVVQAAMPSAVFSIVLTKIYDGDIPTALRVVLATSLVGLVTIPFWLSFGLRLIGWTE
ncbi:MAG: AEC family transporter [Chthoniobacterales bacterium]|nr:AEC family transporter [Chthoniobacterales bacterium]